jgi:hypothetical protein
MHKSLKEAFYKELNLSKSLIKNKDLDKAFYHLERSHVLGQYYVVPHTLSHWYMLKVGFIKKDLKEVVGQLIRLPLGILGSFVGVVPTGNAGGSNVSALKKMEIPEELSKVMEETSG